jgi:hypothetical protein
MAPESWIAPLVASPLIDSSVLAVQSTDLAAKSAKKLPASSAVRSGHSGHVFGSENELSRTCAHCCSLVSVQERCIEIDKVNFAEKPPNKQYQNLLADRRL